MKITYGIRVEVVYRQEEHDDYGLKVDEGCIDAVEEYLPQSMDEGDASGLMHGMQEFLRGILGRPPLGVEQA